MFDQDTEKFKLYLIKEGDVSEFCLTTRASTKKPIAKYHSEDNTIGWNNVIAGHKNQSLAKA